MEIGAYTMTRLEELVAIKHNLLKAIYGICESTNWLDIETHQIMRIIDLSKKLETAETQHQAEQKKYEDRRLSLNWGND